MASSKIKGITIEIGGETTKLGQALEGVEKRSKTLQSELKGVNSLLKLDPKNVELLKQKQDLLTNAVESTKSKLETLKSTMAKINSGEIEVSEEQYRDLQREIASTEQKLKNLETQTKEFGSVSKQQIKEAQKEMEEYGKKAQDAGKKVSDTGTSMLGMSAAVAGVTTAGVMYNMEMETLQANLETLLGSTEAANERLEELRTMGAKTPFETTDLVKATQKMLAFGLDADKTNGYLSTLGDIAMGDANKLDSLTLAFSQIGAAGKASMEDINQMVDAGFNPLTYVMKETGETMTEVRDRVSAGKVSFEEIAGAMQKATSEGGPFYQSMERASETTAGKISTLKDSFSSLVGTLTESLMPTFEKIVDKLSQFAEWFSNLSPAIQEIIIKVALIVAAIGPALIIIGNIITAVGTIIPLISKLLPLFANIKTMITGLFTLIGAHPIIAIITAIIGIIILLWTKCDWFREGVMTVIEVITSALAVAIEWVKNAFMVAWEYIKQIWDYVAPYFQMIWNNIKVIFSVVVEVLAGYFKMAWNNIKIVWDLVVGYFKMVWENIKLIFSVVTKVLSGDFKGAWEDIKKIWDNVKGYFQKVWEGIKGIFGNVGKFFKDAFSSAWEGIKKIFGNVGDFFGDMWNRIKGAFSNIGTKIGSAISDAVKSGINGIIGMIEKRVNTFIGMINGAIKLINKIPGVSISKLSTLSFPRLAEGDVAKPNKPYFAMLGDNKTQEEVISPVNTMRDTFMDALTDFTNIRSQGNSEIGTLTTLLNKYMPEIIDGMGRGIYLDGRKLVGELTPAIDTQLGTLATARKRGR